MNSLVPLLYEYGYPETDETHWKDNVDNIHNDENQVADACKVVGIRGHDQANGDNVVRQHLPVIFSLLLNVDDVNLLDPES